MKTYSDLLKEGTISPTELKALVNDARAAEKFMLRLNDKAEKLTGSKIVDPNVAEKVSVISGAYFFFEDDEVMFELITTKNQRYILSIDDVSRLKFI